MSQVSYSCKVTVAQPHEVGEILEFYKEHKTHAVYLRNEEDIRRSVEGELFAITRNNEGQIIAASGVYILADGTSIECIGNGRSQHGVVAELGSVLRWEEGLPEDVRYKGVWHPFLFSVPMILLAQKAGKGPHQVAADFLVADVQTTERSTLARLMGQTDLTPLFWKLIEHPGEGLKEAFKKTVDKDDENVDNDKFFLAASLGNLPQVAAYLRKCIKQGLTNRYGERLRIDMSDLIERWTENPERKPGELRVTFLDRIVANAGELRNFGNMAWCELPRIFDNNALRRGEPLKGANANYHERVALVANDGEVVGTPASRPSRPTTTGGGGRATPTAAGPTPMRGVG